MGGEPDLADGPIDADRQGGVATVAANLPENSIHPVTPEEWRTWLVWHHAQGEGVWLISERRPADRPALSYERACREALRFGWVGNRANKLDDLRLMNWFAPARPDAPWTPVNRRRAEVLIAAGEMTPAGLAVVATAKWSGSWDGSGPEGRADRLQGLDDAELLALLRAANATLDRADLMLIFEAAVGRSMVEGRPTGDAPAIIRAAMAEAVGRIAS